MSDKKQHPLGRATLDALLPNAAKKFEYNMTQTNSFDDFEVACTDMMNGGWSPQGGVNTVQIGAETWYTQAFTREVKQN